MATTLWPEQWRGGVDFTSPSWLFSSWICSCCSATWPLKRQFPLSHSQRHFGSVQAQPHSSYPESRQTDPNAMIHNVYSKRLPWYCLKCSFYVMRRRTEKLSATQNGWVNKWRLVWRKWKKSGDAKTFWSANLKRVCVHSPSSTDSVGWSDLWPGRPSVRPSVRHWEPQLFIMLSPDVYAGNSSEFFNRMMCIVIDWRCSL